VPDMDKIILKGCQCLCRIGCTEEERKHPQKILFDIEVAKDITKAAASEDLQDTVDYVALDKLVRDIAEKKEYKLQETLIETIAQTVLKQFPVEQVTIKIMKANAIVHADYAGVEITRKK